jgi:hypothetical protein
MANITGPRTETPDPSRDLVINVGVQTDGVTYRLHPKSAQRLRAAFPGVHAAPSVFVGHATHADFRAVHGPVWPQVLMILGGVSIDRLATLGRLVFWNTTTGEAWEAAYGVAGAQLPM